MSFGSDLLTDSLDWEAVEGGEILLAVSLGCHEGEGGEGGQCEPLHVVLVRAGGELRRQDYRQHRSREHQGTPVNTMLQAVSPQHTLLDCTLPVSGSSLHHSSSSSATVFLQRCRH